MPKMKLNDLLISNQATEKAQKVVWDSSFEGRGSFGLRLSKTGSKVFIFCYRVGGNGPQRRATLGNWGKRKPDLTYKQAKLEAYAAAQKAAKGIDPFQKQLEARTAETFEELGQLYIERHALRHKRPTSAVEDQRILNTYVYPEWRKRKAKDIRRRDVIDLLDKVAERGPVMANRVRALLSKLFNFAIQRDLLEFNPVSGVPRLIREKPKEDYLSDEQIRAFWQELDNRGEPTASLFRMILLTAQRPGEVKQMRWDQLDVDEGQWRIPSEVAKNGREHLVPLSALAVSILEVLRPNTEESGWVFATAEGTPVKWLQSMTTRINASVREEAEKEGREPTFRFNPHMLRRSAATHMASVGVRRGTIAKVLNHKSADNTVTAIYDRHHYLPEMRQALERWSSRLQQIITSEPAKVVRMK